MAEIIISSELNKQINVIEWHAGERQTQSETDDDKKHVYLVECSNMCEYESNGFEVWGISYAEKIWFKACYGCLLSLFLL